MTKSLKTLALIAAGSMLIGACNAPDAAAEVAQEAVVEVTLTEQEVNDAQQAWCDALVEIGRKYAAGEDYRAFAEAVIDGAYDYQDGQVFFKPTLTWGEQTFRKTKPGALAYFVGGDENYPNDNGFALKPWVEVGYDNGNRGSDGVMLHGNIGITMGTVHLKDGDGNEIHVDKTFVFRKDDAGVVRLILHKSALPYNP